MLSDSAVCNVWHILKRAELHRFILTQNPDSIFGGLAQGLVASAVICQPGVTLGSGFAFWKCAARRLPVLLGVSPSTWEKCCESAGS